MIARTLNDSAFVIPRTLNDCGLVIPHTLNCCGFVIPHVPLWISDFTYLFPTVADELF